MKGQSEEFGVVVVLGVLAARAACSAPSTAASIVLTRVPGHRRHARDVVRLGRLRAARPERRRAAARRRGSRTSSIGPLVSEWVPKAAVVLLVIVARHLDPGPPVPARPVDLRDRQQPAGGVPERRVRSAGRRSSPTPSTGLFAALGGPGAHRQHGHRHAGPGPYTLDQRRRGRPRRRQPRRRSGRRLRPDRRRSSSSQLIQTDMTFLDVDPNLPRRPGRDPDRRGDVRQPSSRCGGVAA